MKANARATPIHQTIRLLEQEIEAIEQRRGELLRVIESLRPLAGDDGVPVRRVKKALKRNERTNERTSNTRANRPTPEPP